MGLRIAELFGIVSSDEEKVEAVGKKLDGKLTLQEAILKYRELRTEANETLAEINRVGNILTRLHEKHSKLNTEVNKVRALVDELIEPEKPEENV